MIQNSADGQLVELPTPGDHLRLQPALQENRLARMHLIMDQRDQDLRQWVENHFTQQQQRFDERLGHVQRDLAQQMGSSLRTHEEMIRSLEARLESHLHQATVEQNAARQRLDTLRIERDYLAIQLANERSVSRHSSY